MDIDKNILETIVREVVAKHLENGGRAAEEFKSDKEPVSGVKSVRIGTVKPEKFDTGKRVGLAYIHVFGNGYR